MKSVVIDKKLFRYIMDLSRKQPWLSSKFDELETLLFSDCKDVDQQELIIELINRFEYLSNDKYNNYINGLGADIYTEPGINDYDTQIVAMAADSGADSSQYILTDLKFIMQNLGWENHKFVNTFGKSYQTYKGSNSHKNIILVDEFIGSGQTVKNRVKNIGDVFTANGIVDFTIRVKVLVSTEYALNQLKQDGIKVSAQVLIKKGISDYYTEQEAINKIGLMLQMESLLKETINGKCLPSLGYGKAESLYYRERGNVPNNVFPIFWWPKYNNDKNRNTLLARAIGDL